MPLPSWKEWVKKQNTEEGVEDALHSRSERVEPLASMEESASTMPSSPGSGPDLVVSSDSFSSAWVNNANLQSLLEVKGVGPKTAEKIISGRPYTSLDGVPVSPAILEKLKNWADL